MTKKLQPKSTRSRTAARPTPNKGPKVRLEFGSQVVSDGLVVGRKHAQNLKDAIAYYRTELEGNPDKVFSFGAQDACALMADAIALYFEVDGFEMVLRYSEDLGWHGHALLAT